MPIFARRRLQAMLDTLAPVLGADKGRDLLGRLGNLKDVDQAIPAEMELALLGALGQLGPLEIEPQLAGDARPDALSHSFVPGWPNSPSR